MRRLDGMPNNRLHLSSVVLAELPTGAEKSRAAAKNRASVHELTQGMVAVPFDAPEAAVYGRLRAAMAAKAQSVGPLDLLIAAQAVHHGLTVVTVNLREFQRVPGLECENWLK